MNSMPKLGYAVGFIVAVVAIGYGFNPFLDQIRLGLAFGGIALAIVIVIGWGGHVGSDDKIRKMKSYELQQLRPDLQIASKETPATKVLSLEQRYPHFATHSPSDRGTCVKCGLVITLQMTAKSEGDAMYHADCYRNAHPSGVQL